MNNLKTLAIIATTVLSLNVSAGIIECAKYKGRLYPSSPKAIELTKALGVKTCNKGSFTTAVDELKTKMTVVALTPVVQKRIMSRIEASKKSKVSNALSGFKLN